MAVVVDQTIPFPASNLDLANPTRWNTLFPLVRPAMKPVKTTKGQTILVDASNAKSKYINIAAIGSLGHFSSKILDDSSVTAIITEQTGAGILTPEDISHAMHAAGAAQDQGIVTVKVSGKRKVETHGSSLIEAEVESDLEADHLLRLLGHATDTCRTSIHHTATMLKTWASCASTAKSTFHTEKAEGNPAVVRADGTEAFTKAKDVVAKDLKNVMKAQTAQNGSVTYSVHYSDINGLSRLENYILAKTIAEYFETQNLPFALSHSTILDHDAPARGFSISIAPIPSEFLSPQQKPQPHQQAPTSDPNALQKILSPSAAKMSFDDARVRASITSGCNAVIAQEPTITEYDTIVGDGDCGYTLRDGAKQVLAFISDKDLSRLPETVAALVGDLEVNMGGTSGALYCIFLTALAASLATEPSIPAALKGALEQLLKYTRARLGDRTMMDALIPFVDVLAGKGDVQAALQEADKGVDGTKKMEAKLGRSTYLDESATQGVPDPGAYGLFVLLKGMAEA